MGTFAAFAAGVLFAVGLIVGGMTQPSKVVGFLDVTGAWDPSLAFVMGGALAVYGVAYRLIRRRVAPLAAPAFRISSREDTPPKVLLGSALFGVGWGISGFCPGPAVVAVGSGMSQALVFIPAVVVGILLFQWSERARGGDAIPAGESAVTPLPVVAERAKELGPG